MLVIAVQAERMAHTESKHRNNSVEENLKWFEAMLQGNYYYHYYFIYIHLCIYYIHICICIPYTDALPVSCI